MIPQFVISTIAVIIVGAIAAIGFGSRGHFIHIALISAPFVIYLINHPAVWVMLVFALSRSMLIVPGLPSGLQLMHVMMAGFVALAIAQRSLLKSGTATSAPMSDLSLLLFLIVIGLTGAVRGFGLRAFGSESWGGMSYVILLTTGAFVLTAKSISIGEQQLARTIRLMLILSAIPALAQIVFLASRGTIYHQYLFVQPYVGGLLSSLQALETGGPVRLHMMGQFSSTLLMFGCILLDRRTSSSRILFGLVILASVILASLSGFRGNILSILVIAAISTAVRNAEFRAAHVLPLCLSCLLAIPILYIVAPLLPGSVQRSISWLPGINIPWHVRFEAMMSTTMRFQVWEMAWAEVPHYLWIGKGFSVNPADLMSPTVRANWALSAFLGHNYHNGPLSLLLDTGLFGFLFGTIFMIASSVEVVRRLRELRNFSLLKRAYAFFMASHLYSAISFYLIFGDVRESFPSIFVNLAMMYAILKSAQNQRARHAIKNDKSMLNF